VLELDGYIEVSKRGRSSSPDGAQRNPGIDGVAGLFPRIPLALHAGYFLRLMLFGRRILGQKCLR
jgi:hypothetical protein